MKFVINFILFFMSNSEIVLDQLNSKLNELQRELEQENSIDEKIQCNEKFLRTFGINGY